MESQVAYQNKDICSKVFAEKLKGKSFQVYGVNLPQIKQVLPTNLPDIWANELRMDNLFLLEDNTFLIVDYESVYKPENKIKYLDYVLRVLKMYEKDYGIEIKIQVLIIYTADVTREQVSDSLNVCSVKMQVMQAFLSEIDSNAVRDGIIQKIKNGIPLTETEVMQVIILPLTYKGKEQKKKSIKELFELIKEIKEKETQLFLLSGILVFTDKVIDKKTANQMKEWMRMTQVARLYEEEKIEAMNELSRQKEKEKLEVIKQKEKEKLEIIEQKEKEKLALAEQKEKEKLALTEQKEKEKLETVKQIARSLLKGKIDLLDIMKATGLSKKELKELQQEINEDILD